MAAIDPAIIADVNLPAQRSIGCFLSSVPLPKSVAINGVVVGSRVRVSSADNLTTIFLGVATSSSVAFSTKYGGNVIVRARLLGLKPFEQAAIITQFGLTMYISQEIDTVA